MRHRFISTLTGAENGLSDIDIPITSFSGRQKSGEKSTLSAYVPGNAYYEAIAYRYSGQMVITWIYQDANAPEVRQELIRANLEKITPNLGTQTCSVSLSGSKQQTFTPGTIEFTKVISKSPNQTDGRWTYQIPEPIPNLKPGWTATYRDPLTGQTATFLVNEITFNINVSQMTVTIQE